MFKPFDLSDKVVAVIGGTQGIGLSMAQALVMSGATVIVGGRRHELNVQVSTDLGCDYIDIDSTNEESVVSFMNEIITRYKKLDACFVVAGGPTTMFPFQESSLENWDKNLIENVTNVYLCFREASKHMIDLGIKGSLVSVSSVMSSISSPSYEAYSAAKAGVEGLTTALCKHLGQYNIRVNTITPGVVDTPATKIGLRKPSLREHITKKSVFNRLGKPEDFGGLAVYLTSDASSWQTGSTFMLDGGTSKNLI